MTETIATTTCGRLQGEADDGVVRFKGIPFAQPPVGPLRYRSPQPPEPWDGVRPALECGPVSLQNPSPMDQLFGMEPEPASEDCLYLNVCTPAVDDGRRPVMVWIHGGAFIMGSGSSPLYDGATFCRRGDVVFVSLNYRLGDLGFLALDRIDERYAGSGNNAILDQVAALAWVRDNIAGFGGDPGNVTIFGESAGGMSVGTLLVTPAAKGLFHKAIAQSGASRNIMASKVAAEVTDDWCNRVQAKSVDDLLALSAEQILETRAALTVETMSNLDRVLGTDGPPLAMPFQPVDDGTVIPDDGMTLVEAGAAAGIPLLIGTNRDEWKLFGMMDFEEVTDETTAGRVSGLVGDGAGFVAAYRETFPDEDPKTLFGEMATDYAFRIPALRLAEAQAAHRSPVWMYLFDWKSGAFGGLLGAAHAMEVPFVFHLVRQPGAEVLLGADAPVELADQMQDAWIAFARTGDPAHPGLPAWPAYDADRRATMRFAEPCEVVEDPLSATRQLWDTIV
jgi:para-nitrobenzyl esterase